MDVSNVTETVSPQTLRQHSVTMRWSDAFFDKFRRSIGNRSLNTLVDLIREYIRCLKSDITPSHPNPRGAYAFTASIASTLHAFHMQRCDIVESSELRGSCCTGPTYTSYVHSITELIAIYADMRLRSEQLNNEYADRIAHSVILMAQKYLETEYFQAVDVILRMTKLNQHVSAVCEPVFEYILGSIPATTALTPINFTRLVLAYRRRKALYETIEEKANITNRGSVALRALGGAPAGFAMHPLCKKVLKIVIPARATDVPRYLLATGFNTMGAITEFFKWLKTYPESENSLDGFRSLSLNEKPTRRIQSRRQQSLQNRCSRPAEPIFIDLTDDVDDTAQRKNVPGTSSDAGSSRTSRSTQIVPKRPAVSNVEPLCIDLTDEIEPSPSKPAAESIQPNKQPEAQREQPARILNNRPPPVVVDRKNFLAKIIGLAQQAKKNQVLLETEPADKEIPASDETPSLLEKDSTEDSSMEIVPRAVYSGPESSSIDQFTVSKCIDHFESPDSGIEASPTYDNESGTELPSSIESSMKGDEKTLKSLDRHEFYDTAAKSCTDDKCFDSENSTERHDVPVERDRFAAQSDERSIDIDNSYYSDGREEVSKLSSIEPSEEMARIEETRDIQKAVPYDVDESESNGYKEARVEIDTASDPEQVREIETASKDIVSSRRTDIESVEETVKQVEEKKSIEGTIHVTNIEFLQNSELNGRRSVTYDSAEEKDRDEETSIEDREIDRMHSNSKVKRKILGSIAEFVEKFSGSLRNYDDVDEPVIDVTGSNDDCSSDAGLIEKISAVHISPKSDKVVAPMNLQMFGGYTSSSVYPEQAYETKPEYYDRFDFSEQTSSRFKTNYAETKSQPKHFVTLASRKIFDPPAIDTLVDNSVPFVSKIPNGDDAHVELKIPTLQAATDDVENEPEVPCGVHKEIIKLRPSVELTDEHKNRNGTKPDKTKKQVRIKLPEIEVKKQNSLRNVRIDPKLNRDPRTNNGSVDEPKKPSSLKSIQTDQDSFENFFKCKYVPNENGTILNSDSDTAKSPSPSKTSDAAANIETAKTTTTTYFSPTVGFDEPETATKKPARYEQVQKVSTYTEDGVKLIVPILKIRKEDVDAGKEAKKKEKRERRRLEKPRVGFGMWETTYCHGASSKKNETVVEERRKQSEAILKNKTGKEFSIATNGPFTTKRQTGILIKRDYGKLPPGRASLEDDVRNTKIAVRRPSLEETITASRTVSNHHAHVEVTKTDTETMYNDDDRNWTPYEHDVDDEYKNLHVVLTRLNPVDLAILEAQGFLNLRSSIMKGRTNRRGSKKKNEYDTTRSRKKANATKRESKQRQSRPRRKQDDPSIPKRRMRSSSVNPTRTDKEIKTFDQRPLSVDRRMTRSQNRPSLPDKLDEYIHDLNDSFDESITDVRISEDRHKSAAETLDSLMTEMENEFYSNGNETTREADKNESEPRTSDGDAENVTNEVDMIQSNTIDSSQDNMIDAMINTEVHSDTVPEKSSDGAESHEVTKSKDSEERPEDDASDRNVEAHDDRTSSCDALESESKGESIHVESSETTNSPSVDSLKEKEIVLSPNSVKNEWTQVEDRVKDEKFEEYTTTGVVLEQFRESSVERNVETSRETSGNSIPDVDDRASKTFGLCEDAFNFQTDHSNVMKLVYKKLSETTKKTDRIGERAVVQNGDRPKRDSGENEKKSKRSSKKRKEPDIGPAVAKIAEPNYKQIDFLFSKSGKDSLGVHRSGTIESYLREEDGLRKTAGKRRASTSGERKKKRKSAKSGSPVDETIIRFDDRLIKRDSCSSRIPPSYGIDGWENDPYTDSDSSTRAVISDTLDELSSSNTDYSIANPLRKKRKKVLPRMFSVYPDYERTNGATIEKPKKTVPRTYARKQKSILNVYHLPDGRTSSHDDDDTAPHKIRKKKVVRFLTDGDPAPGDVASKQKRKRLGTRIQHNGKQTARHVTGDSLLEDTATRYHRPVSPDLLSDDDRNPTAYAVLIEDAVTTVSPSGIVDSNEMFEDDR